MKEPKIMLATMLGALLVKHRILDRATIDDPQGYDKGETLDAILAVAGDLLDFLGGGDDELESAAKTIARTQKLWKGVCSGCGGSGCDDCKWEGTSAAVITGEVKP